MLAIDHDRLLARRPFTPKVLIDSAGVRLGHAIFDVFDSFPLGECNSMMKVYEDIERGTVLLYPSNLIIYSNNIYVQHL